MSTMNLPPVINPQYLDNNGVILSGGKIYSYQAGTSTPQATYTDQSGVTPNANPIILDSAGRCSMWLDPTLSYKFVIQDSAGNTIKTVDNVVGLLTANAVATASIQDGAVTSSKLAAGSVNVTNLALASDASVDANRPVNTNNIRDSAITTAKIANGAVTLPKISGLLAPTVQAFTSGSGTYNKTYLLQVSSANATVGATYTISAVTYTVSSTISSGTLLQVTGPSAPPSNGTLTRASGSGDATIVYSSFNAPLYLKVKMVGGGGGGSGSGTSGAGSGTAGGNTTFGSSLLTANGGSGGAYSTTTSPGGTGGSATVNSPALSLVATNGAQGGSNVITNGGAGAQCAGGAGAGTPLVGLTPGGGWQAAGVNASANTGAGGSGGGPGNNNGDLSGSGGGAGGYIEALIPSPSATYGYAVGAAGSHGSAGSTGSVGGDGGSGYIVVEEHYQ